ncbi:GNAT family N-acetyltransferase [Streptomyces sp. NBC_01506]|uniref:GNAT family N-acetyltransferase n=1 Tax=Streptomyces sp. NBC_01506 TaxID=2903887 RepID=UPI003864C809
MKPTVRRVSGALLLSHAAGIRAVHADAFAAPPWHEDGTQADLYLERLADDVRRPGFVAALAFDGETVRGFATAWTTPPVFPAGRCYPQVAAALGPRRTTEWLCGGREVDELAVASAAHRSGTGAALLKTVTTDAPDGRCWLLTSVQPEGPLRFYRTHGWRQATHPAPDGTGYAAFLGPGHPARTEAATSL